jgi:hypothetical protein
MAGKCPNHDVPLQPSNEKQVGICPISGYRFKVAIDDMEGTTKIDKFGNIKKDVKVIPLDGEDG